MLQALKSASFITSTARASVPDKQVGKQSAVSSLRRFDVAVTLALILIASPVLGLRMLMGLLYTGHVIEHVDALGRKGETIALNEFTGPFPGKKLAQLFNVLSGELALVGPRPLMHFEVDDATVVALRRYNATPGIFSLHALRRKTGIDYESENDVENKEAVNHNLKSYLGVLLRSLLVGLLGDKKVLLTEPLVKLLNVDISNGTMPELLDWIIGRAVNREKAHLAFVNADCLNIACRDENYLKVVHKAEKVVADGIGVRIGCKMKGFALIANLNGTDLYPRLCERLAEEGLSIFLLGARPGVAEAAGQAMVDKFPTLKIAGTEHGYFTDQEQADVVRKINDSQADVLLVAMGAPRQETWLAEQADNLTVPVRMGVGGLFDFYSGRIQRAPKWLREIGMEWTYRLYREPGRMWRRYVVGNPLFLFRVWREARRDNRVNPAACQTARDYPNLDKPLIKPLFSCLARLSVIGANRVMKRLVDVLVSVSMLLVLAPLFILVAGMIRLESPGNVLIRQTRVGRHGALFTMLKFRSMYQDAETRKAEYLKDNEMNGGVLFKMKQDPRITRVGKLIRKASIDELPQLWNVLRGDMTLVGPRPAFPSEVDQYSLQDRRRLAVKPGITCLWQISGRSDIPFTDQVKLDLDYIHNQSVGQDLGILFKTIPAVVSGRGAY